MVALVKLSLTGPMDHLRLVWQAGEAMLEFLISGTAVVVVFMLIRRIISRLPATIRYAAASTAMSALVALAGYHVCVEWPAPSPGLAVTGGASPSAPLESRAAGPAANPAADRSNTSK